MSRRPMSILDVMSRPRAPRTKIGFFTLEEKLKMAEFTEVVDEVSSLIGQRFDRDARHIHVLLSACRDAEVERPFARTRTKPEDRHLTPRMAAELEQSLVEFHSALGQLQDAIERSRSQAEAMKDLGLYNDLTRFWTRLRDGLTKVAAHKGAPTGTMSRRVDLVSSFWLLTGGNEADFGTIRGTSRDSLKPGVFADFAQAIWSASGLNWRLDEGDFAKSLRQQRESARRGR